MITVCAWCPKDAPPMHDDGKDARVSHGICQDHLDAMREKLATVRLPKEAGYDPDDS